MEFFKRNHIAQVVILITLILTAAYPRAAQAAGGCADCVEYTPGTILLPDSFSQDAGLKFAASELASAMKQLYGAAPKIISDKGFIFAAPGGDGFVAVGCDSGHLEHPDIGVMMPALRLPDEAYEISTINENRPVAVVRGSDVRGCIFGLARLTELIRLRPSAILDAKLAAAPAFSIRIAGGDTAENALLLGYNTVVSTVNHNRAVLLEDFDKEMFDHHGSMRKEVLANRGTLKKESDLDKSLHLDTISYGDEFEFSRALLNRPVSKKITGVKPELLCSCKDDLWKLYATKYAELMRDFPNIDYTMVRVGENYAGGDWFGNMAAPKDIRGYCQECPYESYADHVADLINATWEAVGGKGRKYIQRSWDTNDDTFHSNKQVYNSIIRKIKNRDNFYISVKFTKTDFWRYNGPADTVRGVEQNNETIGAGDVPQIIEYQCQREYEGKGAFPNYIGKELSKAYKYAKANNAAGIWNWHHGGGWNGPTLKTDIWNEANIYAAAHLAWDVNASPEKLARDWAALKFDGANADKIARILMMSDGAVLKLVYFNAYAQKKKSPWMPNENWVRDDEIKGGDELRKIYALTHDGVDDMIKEKNDGVKIVENMLAIAQGLDLPDDQEKMIVDTVAYEVMWARVLRDYSTTFFLWCRWKETNKASDLSLAKLAAGNWQQSWRDFSLQPKTMKWAATAYRDTGMVKTMNSIIGEIQIHAEY